MCDATSVLIVDDSPLMLAMMRNSLRGTGYRVTSARTGEEALRIVAEQHPDLVLLDVVLPDIDGLEVCRRIKADPALADTYILLISSPRKRPEDRMAGLAAGADNYLSRPISPRLLGAHVEAGARLHRALARIRADHDLLASLIDVNPLGLLVADRDGRIVRANPRAAVLLGTTIEHLIGTDLAMLQLRWHGLSTEGSPLQSTVSPFQQVLSSRRPVYGVRFEPPQEADKSRLLVADAAPVLDPNGEVEWVILMLRDITSTIRRLRRISHLNALLRAIRSINQLITRDEPPDRLITQACDLLVASGVYESAWIALINDHDQVTHTAVAGASLKSKADTAALSSRATWPTCTAQALEASGEVLLWPGEREPLEACATCPWRMACDIPTQSSGDIHQQQQALAVTLQHQDRTYGVLTVTARLEAFGGSEEIDLLHEVAGDLGYALHDLELAVARRQAEMRVRMLASHIDDVIFRYGLFPEPGFDYISPTVERLTGYSAEAWSSDPTTLLERVFGEDLAALRKQVRAHPRGEGIMLEHTVRHRDGHTLWVEVRATRMTDDEGRLTAIEGMVRDITERRQLELQLRQQERLAAVGQLAAGIAHDFNNIMSVIVLYSQMAAQQSELDEQTRGRLKVIQEQAHEASKLVQQILDFSRSSEVELHPMDLLAFTKETAKLLERTLPETIQVTVAFEGEGFTINGDPTRIQQVLMNLATNARDAMPQGGQLRFSLRRVRIGAGWFSPAPELKLGEWIRLDVSDTGTGIPPDVLPHIFEPFFTTKPKGVGTGLGLAQVQGIVAQHGGTITVDTQPGSGTTFSIYLPPLDTPSRGNMVGEQNARQTPVSSSKQVLVVEDNELSRAALVDALATLGYEPIAASDGLQALEFLASRGEDIALDVSDAVMPEMGGLELLKEMARRGHQQPCLIVSGYLPPAEKERIEASPNYAGWLAKPVDLNALARMIAEAVRPAP